MIAPNLVCPVSPRQPLSAACPVPPPADFPVQCRNTDTKQHAKSAAAGIQQHIRDAGVSAGHEILMEFIAGRGEEHPDDGEEVQAPAPPHPLAPESVYEDAHTGVLGKMGQFPERMLKIRRELRPPHLAPPGAGQRIQNVYTFFGKELAQRAGLPGVLGRESENHAVQQ